MHTTCEKTKRGHEGNNNNMHSRVAASQIKQAKRRLENWTGEKVSQMWTEIFKKSKMHNWADKKTKEKQSPLQKLPLQSENDVILWS